jgi:hypothetical protein
MGVDAIDQSICPEVLGMTIEHLERIIIILDEKLLV